MIHPLDPLVSPGFAASALMTSLVPVINPVQSLLLQIHETRSRAGPSETNGGRPPSGRPSGGALRGKNRFVEACGDGFMG